MIPESAVEAAAKAHFEMSTNQHMPWEQIDGAYRNAEYAFPMRAALEAAAPHMLAGILALADEADNRPGSMYGKVTTYQLRQAIGAGNE